MTEESAQRLMKLARFLHNVLPENKFDFSVVTFGGDIPNETFSCGTVGCAIGWAPLVFPDLLRYERSPSGESVYVHRKSDDRELAIDLSVASSALMEFFGLSSPEARALFCPYCQSKISPALPFLSNESTPKEVASGIALYVSRQFPEMNASLEP